MTPMPQVTTSRGIVRGTTSEDVHAFRGIPYAAPPVGSRRFAAPEPPASWEGVRDATAPGPTAPQAGYSGVLGELLPQRIEDGEDYLSVDVWTPDLRGNLPVMVFVHGGAFLNGSGSVDGYAGTSFARDGVVLVTLNYRLGVSGFGWIDGAVPNRGLLDQVAALTWVAEEIAAFGGDPDRVTVFGESAGAVSIGCLLAMPSARGLFSRAILQSGTANVLPTSRQAARAVASLAKQLGVSPTREALESVSDADLVQAQSAMRAPRTRRGRPPGVLAVVAAAGMPFQPVVDGEVLPRPPLEAMADGVGREVELVVGHNREEAGLYLVPSGTVDRVTGWTLGVLAVIASRRPRRLLRALSEHAPDGSPGDRLSTLLTERIFAAQARRLARAHGRARVYEFAWRSPAFDGRLGACHALELGFVFDLLDLPSYGPLTGGQAPQALADEMHDAWIAFAEGDPRDWPVHPFVRRLGEADTVPFDGASFEDSWR